MSDIPSEIDLDRLPGPARGRWPAGFLRDDIVWSPTREFFALAYSIAEASMNNDIGCLLWGSHKNSRTEILQNPRELRVACWRIPFCTWVDEFTFVVKAQRYTQKGIQMPAIAIHVHRGFQIVPNSLSVHEWLDAITTVSPEFTAFDDAALLARIDKL